MFQARIFIQLKESVMDPQGHTVKSAINDLGHPEVQDVRIGKYIELDLQAVNEQEASSKVEQYCEQILVNPVIESYRFELEKKIAV